MCLEQLREEFRLQKFGLHHDDPSLFVQSQFGPKLFYLVWVIIWAVYHVIWLFVMEPYILWKEGVLHFGQWFVFLTNWGYILLTASVVTTMVSSLFVYFRSKYLTNGLVVGSLCVNLSPFPFLDSGTTMPWYLKVTWLLYNTSNTIGITVTLGYFVSAAIEFSADSIATHIINSVYILLNLLVSAIPVQILHAYQPVIFILIYAVFYVVYQLCGGVSLYSQLDISNIQSAAVTACCTIFIGVPTVHCVMFALYKVKTLAFNSCRKDKSSSTIQSENGAEKV